MELKTGYKQTEIGVIPEDWNITNLGSLAIIKDGTHQTPTYVDFGIPFYSVEHVTSGDFQNTKHISEAEHKLLTRRYRIEYGDVLMTRIGSIGDCKLIDWNPNASFYVSLALLKFSNKQIAKYFACFSQSKIFKTEIDQNSLLHAVPKKINLGKISNLRILLPSTSEIEAITESLSDTNAYITSLEKLIEKKRQIKQGAMQELLKPKDGWETKTLKEVATYRRGSFPQPYGLDKWYDDISGFPFVQVFDVDDNNRLKDETKRRISKLAQQMSVFVKKGSIILTIQGSIGRIALTQYDAYVDRTLLIFEAFKVPFDSYFFMISIWRIFEIEKELAPGGIIKTITKEALSSFKISYPSINEQIEIASILSKIDEEILGLENKLLKAKFLKEGMMQNLLTGKIRLS